MAHGFIKCFKSPFGLYSQFIIVLVFDGGQREILDMAKLVSRLGGSDVSTLVMSAVGVGLSVGSWSATRDGSYFDNPLLVPAMPVVMVFAALILAVAFKKEKPQPRSLFVAAAILVAVQLLAIPLVSLLSESEKLVLGILMTAVEGTASTLLTFLFLESLVRFSPRQIAVTIASGYLLVHLYDGLFLWMPQAVCLIQRPLALLAMVALAGALCRRMRGRERGGETSFAGEQPAAVRPDSVAGCFLLAGLIAVLLLIQGVYSQMTGLGSVGNVQAFNLFTELFAAGVRTAVLVYCLLRTEDVPMWNVAACAVLVFLVGIPVVYLSWGTGAYLAGSHIINSARYILLPLAAIVGVQAARRFPDKAAFLILIMMAAANSCYVSRLVAGVALDSRAAVDAIVPTVSLCSMWVVACVVPLYLLARERLCGGAQGMGEKAGVREGRALLPNSWEPADPALRQEIEFYRRLDDLCDKAQLTEREKEILREVLHGYSIESIAGRLNLSASTVKTYLSRAYTRFGVSSRQAVLNLIDGEGAHEG